MNRYYILFQSYFHHSWQNVTMKVKELLKLVHICENYEVKYACLFFSEKQCTHTYLTFQVSQGNAATDLRWVKNFNKFLFRNSLLFMVVKKLRKSVNICLSYRKNKSVSFFYGPQCSPTLLWEIWGQIMTQHLFTQQRHILTLNTQLVNNSTLLTTIYSRVVKTAHSFWSVNRRRLCCTRCYCTTCSLVCRSSFIHCSRPKCSNCSCISHPLISITRCSQAKFDTCQEPTSRLHASQWKGRYVPPAG